MTYSLDFREKVLSIKVSQKLTFSEVSARFQVAISTIVRWSKKIEPQLTRNKPATRIDMDALKKNIDSFPDAYQYERAERLGVSRKCVFEALRRVGVTYKKNTESSQSGRRKTICILKNP